METKWSCTFNHDWPDGSQLAFQYTYIASRRRDLALVGAVRSCDETSPIIRRESAQEGLEFFCFPFQPDPPQFPNELEDLPRCALLRSLIGQNEPFQTRPRHRHPP